MMTKHARFNIYLCVVLALVCGAGCRSEKSKKKKEITLIELHQEVNRDGFSDNESVPIGRENAFMVNVDKSPIVDGGDIAHAEVLTDTNGLFMIKLKFNLWGTQLLDGATSANQGKRIAVFCSFGPSRWIASPVIRRRIGDGVFVFTPDCTKEEADRIVRGLNNVAKKLKDNDKL